MIHGYTYASWRERKYVILRMFNVDVGWNFTKKLWSFYLLRHLLCECVVKYLWSGPTFPLPPKKLSLKLFRIIYQKIRNKYFVPCTAFVTLTKE